MLDSKGQPLTNKLQGTDTYPEALLWYMMIETLCNGDYTKYDFIKCNFSSVDYIKHCANNKYNNYISWLINKP